jgi:hypothetical protein
MTPFLHLEIDLEQERENFYICAVAVVIQSVEFTYKATFLEHIATFFSFTVSQQGHGEQVDSSSAAAEQTVIQFKRPMHLTIKMRKPYFLFSANTMASNSNIVLILAVESIHFASPALWHYSKSRSAKRISRATTVQRHDANYFVSQDHVSFSMPCCFQIFTIYSCSL